MDTELLYRIAGLAVGLLAAFLVMNLATLGQRKAAKARHAELNRTQGNYWARPSRMKRRR
jgi:hypothetical protein